MDNLKPIMENDMNAQSTPPGPNDFKELADLSKYSINRHKARIWAHKDIKFLTYDDTDLKLQGYDSDDSEGMLEFATNMSNQGLIHKSTSTAEAPGEGSRPGKHACDVCSMVSEFPRNRKTRKFRLHRPADVVSLKSFPDITVCSHYAAISYCWPEPQQDEQGNLVMGERTYQVRDIDGKTRLNRALDDVLDRAVDFAISCGVRMIWIDQECLPQPNEKSPQEQKEDQQLGIQAMDIVYNRASVTGGLISTQVTDQAQLDAVYMLTNFRAEDVRGGMRWVGDTPPPVINHQILNHVLDFLEMVGRDRWYTRAWVVQEALCAGTKLLIALRRGPGISWPSEFRVPGRSAGDPLSTPHPPTPRNYEKFPSEIVCIPIKNFQSMVQAARFFLEHDFITMGNVLVRYGGEDSTTITREKRILDVAEALHPVVVQSKTQVKAPRVVGGNNYGERQTVDAAGALTLLHTRGCRDVQDRVAIVANMCNFETRLNTFDVARNCKSLRMALIALSLLNGDCSILAPEAYRLGHAGKRIHKAFYS